MSHYIKLLMDAIFGRGNFINEIVWSYSRYTAKSNKFQREHDILLMYGKVSPIFNVIYRPHGDKSGQRDSHYKKDEDGKWFRWQQRRGQEPYKVYLPTEGRRIGDVWPVSHINSSSKERTGYPTQKPIALLDRIIKASSNEGDIVLDPFAGCATACVAANELNREWAGIDVSPVAFDLVRRRIEDRGGLFYDIRQREDVPERTDTGDIPKYNCKSNREQLYGMQGGHCAACGHHFKPRNLTVDHIIARSVGGTDHLSNLQLLCGACNSTKGNRGMEYLMAQLNGHASFPQVVHTTQATHA